MKTLSRTCRFILNNRRAFTLVEICVAMVITSVLIFALAQYSLSIARAQKSQSLSNDFTELNGLVGQVLGNETLCTSAMAGQSPATGGAFSGNLVVTPPGSTNPQTVLSPGLLPSGLYVLPITFGTVTVGGTSGVYTQKTVDIVVSAYKGPLPSASPTSAVNPYFIGNSNLTKTYTIGVWTSAGGVVSRCTTARDMARGYSLPLSYAPPAIGCPGVAPTCPNYSPAVCCTSTLSPVPFWECPSNGWVCT